MTKHAAFLRAVNVGGNNKVPMATLRDLATGLDYTDVATYLQSGNLVLDAGSAKASSVEAAISKAIKSELGLTIDVVVRTHAELKAVAAKNPFSNEARSDPKSVHVSFLAGKPTAAVTKACDPEEFLPDRFEFGDRCLYLLFSNGSGRSKLATAPWAKRLGMPGTARNWRTVTTMLDMLSG